LIHGILIRGTRYHVLKNALYYIANAAVATEVA